MTTLDPTIPTAGPPTTAPAEPQRRRIVRRNGPKLKRTEEIVIPAEQPAPEAPPAQEWQALTEFPAELVSPPVPPRPPPPVPYVMVGNVKVTPDMLQAAEKLGVPKKWVDNAKNLCIEQLGDFLNVPFVGKMLMIDGFDGIGQVKFVMNWCREIMEATPEVLKERGFRAADKLAASEMMTLCFKPLRDFIDQGVELAEKVGPKKDAGNKPKNRPPMAAFQVNFNPPPNGGEQSPKARIGFPEAKPAGQG